MRHSKSHFRHKIKIIHLVTVKSVCKILRLRRVKMHDIDKRSDNLYPGIMRNCLIIYTAIYVVDLKYHKNEGNIWTGIYSYRSWWNCFWNVTSLERQDTGNVTLVIARDSAPGLSEDITDTRGPTFKRDPLLAPHTYRCSSARRKWSDCSCSDSEFFTRTFATFPYPNVINYSAQLISYIF